ncbi:catechol 1,2-dioxygenase [Marinobacter bohaiensis]|uniref:catechol 1,2-dioxygenase n=1 Tax=Marinobacter bohaiensis TaxID=2201898 RepID=UPI000DAC34A5|nr:catechol 1,2-dioxygenase [Marinobacter bohaiensis]
MTVKTMHTQDVKELLEKVAGFDQQGGNDRYKKIIHRLVGDVYRLIEDFDVTPDEFWHAVNYVNRLGQNGEAPLLAPGLGFDHYLDIRMDAEDAERGLTGGTPRTIEGPLYVAGAPISDGFARMDDGSEDAETMIVTGVVRDENGQPLKEAVVDIWHANTKGGYSYFDTSQSEYNLRRRIRTDENGRYVARSIVPSGYGCPPEGATQAVLDQLGRHGNRPAHIHYFVSKPGYRHLTTQINLAGDQYVYDDFAFATREELVIDAERVEDPSRAEAYGLNGPFTEVVFNVDLVSTDDATLQDRHTRARALEGEAG